MLFSTPSVLRVLAVFVAGLGLVSSLPLEEMGYKGCKQPRIRKEWRRLSDSEKKDYLRAVNCLHSIPGTYDDIIDGLSAYEDYVYVHKVHAPYIHLVYIGATSYHGTDISCGLMKTVSGIAAATEAPNRKAFQIPYSCNCASWLTGPPTNRYWDYTLDVPPTTEVANLLVSPIFSPQSGFGGDGEPTGEVLFPNLPKGTGGGCISDGPFSNWTIHIGKNVTIIRDDRCLQRSLNPTIGTDWCNSNVAAEIMVQKNYGWMSHVLEGEPSYAKLGLHGGGHFIIGGTDGDIYTSNAEPIFYLHHTNLDRIWRQWQAANLKDRLWDISGPIAPWSDLLKPNRTNLPEGNVTVHFGIDLGRLGATITVGDVMDTMGGFLCYDYE